MGKQWLEEIDKDILYFTPFYEEIRLAEVFYEEDGGWCYSSKLLRAEGEYLGSDSREDAWSEVEDLIETYLESELDYHQRLLDCFRS